MTQQVLNSRASQYADLANQAADANGIPREIFLSLVQQESSFDPYAHSADGGKGLTQLTSPGALAGVTNPYDPKQNLNAGARWLKQNYDRAGNWADALSMYNSGRSIADSEKVPGKFQGAGGNYAGEVLDRALALGYQPDDKAGTWMSDPFGKAGEVLGNAANALAPAGWLEAVQAWLQERVVGVIFVMGGAIVLGGALWYGLKPDNSGTGK